MSLASFPGYDRLAKKIARIQNLDPTPLLLDWGAVIMEDNRAGVLAGLDKDGVPMAPVTYRTGIATPTRFRRRAFGVTSGTFKAFGPLVEGLDVRGGNLTTSQYKRLTGPPLAPRLDESRVIANLHLIPPYFVGTTNGGGTWIVEAEWFEVVNVKGKPFLHYHFEGQGRNPRRDLRGVRPQGKRKMLDLLRQFVRAVVG